MKNNTSNSHEKRNTDDPVHITRQEKVLLALLPFWTPLIPPLGISCLKSYLKKNGYHAKAVDLNIEVGFKQKYDDYFNRLKEYVPHENRGNFYNTGHQVLQGHMMARMHHTNEKEYFALVKLLVHKNFYVNIDEQGVLKLHTILTQFYKELENHVLNLLEREKPAVLGLSVYSHTLAASMFAFKLAKAKYPDIMTVMGGAVFSQELEMGSADFCHFLDKAPYIDKIIIGEGEALFLSLLRGELPASKRVYTLKDINNNLLDISSLGIPDFSDFDLRYYLYKSAYTSRSCPYQCKFCAETVYWGRYRKKNPGQILQELKQLYETTGSQLYLMCDSLLNPVVAGLANELINSQLSLYWDGYLRVDKHAIDPDTTRHWRKGGLYRARLGVESGSQRILDLMDKQVTVERIKTSVKNLANAGIKTTTYWIVGYPGETEEDFQQTLDLLEELKDHIYEAECNHFSYFLSGQVNSEGFAQEHNVECLYPEEVKDMLIVQHWILKDHPSREETFERLNRFVEHCKKSGIPNPYSLQEIYHADIRWEKLHSNAVPPLIDFVKQQIPVNDFKSTPTSPETAELAVIAGQYKKEREYWLNQLAEAPGKIYFPYDSKEKTIFKNNDKSKFKNEIQFQLTGDLFLKLLKLSNQSDYRLYMILLTGLILLLNKYTSQDDIIIGSPIFKPEVEENFINTILILRSQIKTNFTFKQLLLQTTQTVVEAANHVNYPLKMLLYQLDIPFDEDDFPLFDTVLLLENIQDRKYLQSIHPNIIFSFLKTDRELMGRIEYNRLLYSSPIIKRIVDHFRQLLEKALFDVNSRLEAIRFLSKHEKKQLLYDFNDTGAGYPENKTIYELFSEQVKKNPDRIALVEGDRNLGCRELNQRANRLAHLLRKKGVKPDTIVGIMLERSIQLVMGILAILKAGGAYLPIDTESPTNRVTSLLNDTRAPILLTDSQGVKNHSFLELQDNFLSHQAPYTTADILLMDDLSGCFTEGTGKNPEPGSHANNLAYTIFTSGSTGIPKGVLIDHGSLVNYTHWAAKNYLNTNENQVVYFPFYTSSAFDLTVTSLFLPLITGNTIIIYSQEHKGLEITKAIDDIRVGIIKLTPSHLKLLREKNSRNPNIQCLITGGEELETRLARDIGMHFSSSTKIFNEYGPTEATVGCMIHQFNSQTDTGRTVPIGIPADNVQIHILDQHLEPLPVGGIGEIYISGFGIARGYLNNPEITMKRFIRNPFVPGKIMYKSGDMAKRLANGTIEFLGRIDQQVKIKGCRIEPGEIEHKLTTCPGIKEAIVLVRKDNDGNDDRQLAAYWVPEDHDSPLRISVLKDYLAGELPEYMIPDYFVKIDGIPLTVNGKVDVKTLPEVESIVSGENYVGPRNQLEEKFVEVWQEVLRIERVGINDNFFELGGDSLKAIQLASKLNHTDFTIDKLFIHQTINRICSSLVSPNDSPDTVEPIKEYPAGNHRDNDMERTSSTDDVFFSNPSQSKKVLTGKKKKEMIHQLDHNGKLTPLLKMNKTRNKYPIAPVQQSFFSLPYQAVAVKNTIHHYDFPGSNIDHIKKIVVKLINENSLMRSIIEKKNGSYSIVEFDSFANIEIPFLDISNYSSHCNEEILNMLYKNLCKPLELLDELLYRVCVVKTDNKTLKLIFAMNHLIFDGESIKILKNKIQNITERPGEFKETRMKKKDYYDYVKFMLDLSYEGIDLEKHANFGDFFKYGNKIHEKFEIGEIGYGDLEIDIGNLTEDLKNYYNEMMLLCYANLINELWDTRGVSLLFASNGRNYKDGNFNDILGDFHDIIPVFLSFEKNPHPQKVIEEFINYRQYIKNHNINFVNYFRKTPRLLKKYLRIPTSPFIYNSLIGMYHFLKNKSTDPVSREVEKQNIKGPYFELYVSKDIYSTKLYVYFQQNSRFTPEEIKNQLIKNFKDLVQRLNK